MYGIFTYIYLKFMVNVGKYTIHGCYGLRNGLFLANKMGVVLTSPLTSVCPSWGMDPAGPFKIARWLLFTWMSQEVSKCLVNGL